mmetsp:Transcript_15/g.31  ORF Transcript_15/g.31 Transcript_15/m.31 type:complete len:158 (+) Transcript_15:209-682(+)
MICQTPTRASAHRDGIDPVATADAAIRDLPGRAVEVATLPLRSGRNPFDIHVYFSGKAEAAAAARLRRSLLTSFDWLCARGWWDTPIGPHPLPMFEVDFGEPARANDVNTVAEWLRAHADGLIVLLHPNTTDGMVADHTTHAMWIGGDPLPLKLDKK